LKFAAEVTSSAAGSVLIGLVDWAVDHPAPLFVKKKKVFFLLEL